MIETAQQAYELAVSYWRQAVQQVPDNSSSLQWRWTVSDGCIRYLEEMGLERGPVFAAARPCAWEADYIASKIVLNNLADADWPKYVRLTGGHPGGWHHSFRRLP